MRALPLLPLLVALAAVAAVAAPAAAAGPVKRVCPRPLEPAAMDQGAPPTSFSSAIGALRRPAGLGDVLPQPFRAPFLQRVYESYVRAVPGLDGFRVDLIPGRMAVLCHPGRTVPVLCVFSLDERLGGGGSCSEERAIRRLRARPLMSESGGAGRGGLLTALLPDGVDSATAIYRGERVSAMVRDNVFVARIPGGGLRSPDAIVERDGLGRVIRVVRFGKR